MRFYFLILLLLVGCKNNLNNPNQPNNPDIIKINIPPINNNMSVMNGNNIYSVTPPFHFKIDEKFIIIDSYELPIPFGNWTYIEINNSGTKLLLVKSTYADVSSGSLYEFDLKSEQLTLIQDRTQHVSSAVYWNGNDNRLVYYKYGIDSSYKAGYYVYDKVNKTDSLLLSYRAIGGRSELVNGFDLHPNNDRLLIPLCQSTLFKTEIPRLGEYKFGSAKIDTLLINFDQSFLRIGLWTRYNKEGDKILYCVYPRGSYGFTTNDFSEVGLIDYSTLTKKILDVNTNIGGQSVQLAPNWNNDFMKIVYGSGVLISTGAVGRRELFLLNSIEQ